MPDLFYYRLASITREYMFFPIDSIPGLGLGRGPGTCGKPKIEFWRHLEADCAKQDSVRSTCCKETWNKGGVFSRSLVCRRGVSWHGRAIFLVPCHQRGGSWYGTDDMQAPCYQKGISWHGREKLQGQSQQEGVL